jgi:hypothetical protein
MTIDPMKRFNILIACLLIIGFTFMIVNKCVFIGSGQSILAFCYEMEDDIESKGNKSDILKETEKYCKSLLTTSIYSRIKVENFHVTQNIAFAEGHPSQPDLPPEA